MVACYTLAMAFQAFFVIRNFDRFCLAVHNTLLTVLYRSPAGGGLVVRSELRYLVGTVCSLLRFYNTGMRTYGTER